MFFKRRICYKCVTRSLSVISDEELLEKIKKGIEKSGDRIEKGVKRNWDVAKQFGNKVKDVEPVEAFVKCAKMGLGSLKELVKI